MFQKYLATVTAVSISGWQVSHCGMEVRLCTGREARLHCTLEANTAYAVSATRYAYQVKLKTFRFLQTE